MTRPLLLSLLALLLGAGAAPARAETVTIACGTGVQLDLCKESANKWMEATGHTVEFVSAPNSSTELLALYQQMLAAGAEDIDVFQIDVIWPGILGDHFIDLNPALGEVATEHFEAIIDNNTVDGRLVAMPWYTDAGLLYYRTDLLEKYDRPVPNTWQALTDTAEYIQEQERAAGNDLLWGYVFQGKAYEGLTCNALEWVASQGGGTVVADDGDITINNPAAVEAVKLAGTWVGGITPEGVLNYAEEEARGVFQSGNAVFMRNWPYAYSLSQGEDSPVKDRVGIAVLPEGEGEGSHAAALGGWHLAVSKYSEHPEIATDLVRHLTSAGEQKMRAIQGSFLPTIRSLYEDEEILAVVPFFGELYEVFTSAVPRPSTVTGDKYNQVSNEFWNAVHGVLSGNTTAEQSLADLESALSRLSRGGRRW